MNNLFAYGTLMCEDIFRAVSGCQSSRANCVLKDYRRFRVKGEHYPGIIPVRGSCVEGIIYFNIPHPAWNRLDRFEGDMYKRQAVKVAIDEDGPDHAFTYVVRAGFVRCLERQDWNLNDFVATGRKLFEKSYRGYINLK